MATLMEQRQGRIKELLEYAEDLGKTDPVWEKVRSEARRRWGVSVPTAIDYANTVGERMREGEKK